MYIYNHERALERTEERVEDAAYSEELHKSKRIDLNMGYFVLRQLPRPVSLMHMLI
ncbi:hypothetical protein [Methanomethylovorans sp.]|uniref:hypothetical protein n=1 Tax=Methanomethylovorans sp. TaxID=2758717 RepID=UPI003D0E19DF